MPDEQARCAVCGREKMRQGVALSSNACLRDWPRPGEFPVDCYRLGFERVTAERDSASEQLRKEIQRVSTLEAANATLAEMEKEARTRLAAAEAERDRLRSALGRLLVWADRVAPRLDVRMNDPNTGARDEARAALAAKEGGESLPDPDEIAADDYMADMGDRD